MITWLSKASIFTGKFVTSRCCLDDGLRRTGDWSEAGITLSCCCSVICSVSPDRHWLVLIMATRGAGGGLIREADTEHPDSQAGSGARHTPIPDTALARMPGESSLTWAQASSSLLTASQHYSQFLCSHQHCSRGCVMKTHLYVDSCLCLEKWQKTKYTKISYLHKIKLNFVKLVSITILTWYSISKLKRVYKNKICVHLKSILNKIPKVHNTMKYFCIWGQRWMKVLWEFQDYFIWSLLWKAHIW